jgi:hypothetical protein
MRSFFGELLLQTAFGKKQTILANFELILSFNFAGEIERPIFYNFHAQATFRLAKTV